MRAKAAYDKIREETFKNNELLKEKANKEHEQALKQMNDMVFLQNKKLEIQKQEEENQKKVAEFARMKMLLEQQNMSNTQNKMVNLGGISGMGVIPAPSANGNINEKYEEVRRKNINQQLQSIKNKVQNIDIKEDIETEPLYLRAANAKPREPYNNQSNTKDDTDRSTTSSSKSSSETSSKTSTDDSRRKSEKSVSTTLSKRKYNKKGITIQTS